MAKGSAAYLIRGRIEGSDRTLAPIWRLLFYLLPLILTMTRVDSNDAQLQHSLCYTITEGSDTCQPLRKVRHTSMSKTQWLGTVEEGRGGEARDLLPTTEKN